jgi:hypothetical protein
LASQKHLDVCRICDSAVGMLQAFVGIVSRRGLEVFCPEHPDTVQFLWRRARRTPGRTACFWSVIPDDAAVCVQNAMRTVGPEVAFGFLQQSVREMGTLLPSDMETIAHSAGSQEH